jgi:hypothetical protein
MKATSIADVIAAEAGGRSPKERYQDMLGIASAIANRMAQTGETVESIIGAPNQFDAYGKAMPPGTEALRSLAEKAWKEVQTKGPTHTGAYYARDYAVDNLPGGLKALGKTAAGHHYFADPKNRAIATLSGYKSPRGLGLSLPDNPPTPTARPTGLGATQVAGLGAADINPARWGGLAPAPDPGVLGNMAAKPAGGLFGATTGIDPNRPFDFAGIDMGRMLSKNVAISPEVARAAAAPKTSPQNWDAGPASPFDFSKIDMGRMLSNTATRGTGWAPAPSTPSEQAARTAVAAANNTSLDSEFSDMLTGLDNRAFAAIQGNELQIGKTGPPETQIAAAGPTVSATLSGGLSPSIGIRDDIDLSTIDAPDETMAAYGPDESLSPMGADDTISAPEETPSQSRLERIAQSPLGRAAIGGLLGGPIGAAIGLGSGLFDGDMDLGGLGRGFGPAGLPSGAERRNAGFAGYGMHAMEKGMYGPRGTLGMSRSQPGTYSVSRGPGLGYDLTNKYGARTTYSADGHIMGNSNLSGRLGGLFGGLFGGKSDKMSKAERDKYSGKAGLY